MSLFIQKNLKAPTTHQPLFQLIEPKTTAQHPKHRIPVGSVLQRGSRYWLQPDSWAPAAHATEAIAFNTFNKTSVPFQVRGL